jgi:hypothetical protein
MNVCVCVCVCACMTYSFVVCLNAVDLYTCIHSYTHTYTHTYSYIITYIHKHNNNTYVHTHTHTHTHTYVSTHTHVAMLKCALIVVFFSVWPLQTASASSCPILILEFSSAFPALQLHYFYVHVFLHHQPIDWLFAGIHTMYVTHNVNIYSFVILHILMKDYNILVCLFFCITN